MPKIRTFLMIISFSLIWSFSLVSEADQNQFFDLLAQAKQMDWTGRKLVVSWTEDHCAAFELMVVHGSADKYYQRSIYPERPRSRRNQSNANEERKKRESGRRVRSFRPTRLSAASMGRYESLIRNNYVLDRVEADVTICGREAQIWSITPHESDRNKQFKVWLDSATGILLQSEQKNGQNRQLSVLTQLQFNQQLVNDRLAELKRNQQKSGGSRRGRLVSKSIAQQSFKQKLSLPDDLLSGFQIEEIELMERPVTLSSSIPTVHLRYTDGLEMVSVFQSLSSAGRDRSRGNRRGDRPRGQRKSKTIKQNIAEVEVTIMERVDVRVYQWNDNDIDFTLIGDLAQSEMDRMVKSLILNR